MSFKSAFQAADRQLVRLVDDVDLVLALGRVEHRALADLAHLVDPALRCRVHLDHVERRPVRDRPSDPRARVEVRRRPALGIERLREDARHRGLARPARPGEEVRLPYLVALDRVPERPDDGFLADDLREVERPVRAVERRHDAIVADRCGPGRLETPGRALRRRTGRPRVVSSPPARVGRCRGTWEGVLSAASFRT